jgi:Zn ribbon nucleic-acid-binding protein
VTSFSESVFASLAERLGKKLSRRRTRKVVGCPYCVEGDTFRLMIGHLDGRFICIQCGYMARADDLQFTCYCPRCLRLKRVTLHNRDITKVTDKLDS